MSDDGLNGTAKRSFLCECSSAAFVAADTVSLEFIWPGPVPRGGQFFLIKPKRTGVFLGRPISVAGRKAGGSGVSILRFLVVVRGQGSRELAELRPGEEAELSGPLGNCWPITEIKGPVALIGRETGIAPLLMFAQELEAQEPGNRPFDFYAGFVTGSFGLENIRPRSLVIATRDGSLGIKGRITNFFKPCEYSGVFVCGPKPMLKEVGEKCIACGVPCFVSIEKHMACGVGACLGCSVKTTGGNRRCCSDGPIFDARELCFDE